MIDMQVFQFAVNQLLFASEKISQGSRERHHRENLSPRTSPCRMVVKTARVRHRLLTKISRREAVNQ